MLRLHYVRLLSFVIVNTPSRVNTVSVFNHLALGPFTLTSVFTGAEHFEINSPQTDETLKFFSFTQRRGLCFGEQTFPTLRARALDNKMAATKEDLN